MKNIGKYRKILLVTTICIMISLVAIPITIGDMGGTVQVKIKWPSKDPAYFTAGEVVIFNCEGSAYNSLGEPIEIKYYWKFDDGFYSCQKMIGHLYEAPGEYNVILRGYAPALHQYAWDFVDIIILEPLTADVFPSASGNENAFETYLGEPIQFHCNVDGGMPPYQYEWDFGDGIISNIQNPTHIYESCGLYTTTIKVTDDMGNIFIDTIKVTVKEIDELVVSLSNSYNGIAGKPIQFSHSVHGGITPYSYYWDFGDGFTSTETYPTHTYESYGTYKIKLSITDKRDNKKTVSSTVYIDVPENEVVDIQEIKGGFGLSAIIKTQEKPVQWTIDIDGLVIIGDHNSGIIQANSKEVVNIPFTFGVGKINILITANYLQKNYKAFAIGPILLDLQEI